MSCPEFLSLYIMQGNKLKLRKCEIENFIYHLVRLISYLDLQCAVSTSLLHMVMCMICSSTLFTEKDTSGRLQSDPNVNVAVSISQVLTLFICGTVGSPASTSMTFDRIRAIGAWGIRSFVISTR